MSSSSKVTVLYKISNVKGEDGAYNAFELQPAPGGISLASVKGNCYALRHLSRAGSDGYHWRVRVDDKVTNPKAAPKYSWWDIQDEAARLPIKQVGFSELQNLLSPTRKTASDDALPTTTKGVVRSLGKAMNKVAASVEGNNSSTFDGGPRVPILMFKLLDLVKLQDEHGPRNAPVAVAPHPSTRNSSTYPNNHTTAPNPRASQTSHAAPTGRRQPRASQTQQQTQPPRHAGRQPVPSRKPAPAAAEGSLMDFGPGPSRPHHSNSAPSSFGAAATTPAPPSNETRAQKLKREYEKKNSTENRVWDEIDQRWVAVDAKKGAPVNRGSTSAPPGAARANSKPKPKVKGVSLDQVNTVGKSENVANAVQTRVKDMKDAQQKAVTQIREREEEKKKAEAEEDLVRQRLEPKIKAWSEEHGKKKQLRALLASLHTILWPEANWKTVNLGDLLDDRKCKLSFHKASRVVHPDKTMKLPAEQRFLAKRIFDALSQAKTEFDNN
jgi:hypothetical protein